MRYSQLFSRFFIICFLSCQFSIAQDYTGIWQNNPVNTLDVNGGVTIGAGFSGVSASPPDGAIIKGSVGIGTAIPQHMLHVLGDVYVQGADLIFSDAGIGNIDHIHYTDVSNIGSGGVFSFYADGNMGGQWDIPTAGISAKGVYVDGKMGIGTTVPDQRLDVKGWVELGDEITGIAGTAGSIRYHSAAKIQFHDGTQWIDLLAANNVDDDWAKSGGGVPDNSDSIYHLGSVSIGTTVPQYKLHVTGENFGINGDRYVAWFNSPGSDDGGVLITIGDDNADESALVVNNSALGITDLFNVRSDGHVGINTSAPSAELDLHGDFHIDSNKPIVIRRFENLGDNINFDTGYSITRYAAAITGWGTQDGDINENGTADMFKLFMYENSASSTWFVKADMRSHNNDENWFIDIMFVDKHMVDLVGDWSSSPF